MQRTKHLFRQAQQGEGRRNKRLHDFITSDGNGPKASFSLLFSLVHFKKTPVHMYGNSIFSSFLLESKFNHRKAKGNFLEEART